MINTYFAYSRISAAIEHKTNYLYEKKTMEYNSGKWSILCPLFSYKDASGISIKKIVFSMIENFFMIRNHAKSSEAMVTFSPDINECQNKPCKNRTACVNLPGTYRCDCTPGYTGKNCETGIPIQGMLPSFDNENCFSKV